MVKFMEFDNLPPLMKVGEAAQVLRKGKNFIYQEVQEGRIPHIRLGNTVRIIRDEWLAQIRSQIHG